MLNRKRHAVIEPQAFGLGLRQRLPAGETLICDADDTLWENNIYFERAIDAFLTYLAHSRLSHAQARAILDEIARKHGYGSNAFARSLEETFRHLAERDVAPADLAYIHSLAQEVRQHPLELLPGVAETLATLATRHHLILLTKGEQDEQCLKIEASGLESYFALALIVAEKTIATYTALLRDLQLDPAHAWMIGNSPRSDINPALAAGLNAVFVPHPHTWRLEHEEVQPVSDHRTLLHIERFADLQRHF
jgi:putative hydrolase of the HAD superfamily